MIYKGSQMILNAKSDYIGIISKYGLGRVRKDGTGSALLRAKRRGVKVRLISEVDNGNAHNANFLSRHIALRKTVGLTFYLDVIDRKEMVIGPAITDEEAVERSKREADLWTNNSKFIQGMYGFFEKLWLISTPHVSGK